MANLNFQQPPRSLANTGLSRNGGFGSSSLSGHVTPTSGMFPAPSNTFTPQQLSPNRNLPSIANRSLFGPRSFQDRRQVPGLGSVMQDWSASGMGPSSFSMGGRSYGGPSAVGMGNFHSVFSSAGAGGDSGGSSSTPAILDLSEFPSLTARGGQGDSMPQPQNTMPGKQPYVGMVKQPTSDSSEFTMSSEDFPALPGTSGSSSSGSSTIEQQPGGGVIGSAGQVGIGSNGGGSTGMDKALERRSLEAGESGDSREGGGLVGSTSGSAAISTVTHNSVSNSTLANKAPGSEKHRRGIQTSSDGKVTNIPNSMVKDQFGMVGLLTFIRAAETDPNLVSLALGQDLTALGLNLNSPDNLYPTFGGPWAEHPCRAQDIDYHVPPEYIINHSIRDKLAQVKLARYKDDLLFFLFYTSVGDMLQLAAADELYSREWRYHMEEKVWLTQAPGCGVIEKTSTYERGTYFFFDAQNWRKVAKEFHLDYSKLENQPTIPNTSIYPTPPV